MNDVNAPYHAHIYYVPERREQADALRSRLIRIMESGDIPELMFVGQLRDGKAGPHPIAQFEIHYLKPALPRVMEILERSGLIALVHPLTDDDLADHTTLATWIGIPLELDLSTLDPPGQNKGVPRFGKTDF
jgi:aromatic ring-cleaving dioxygenase